VHMVAENGEQALQVGQGKFRTEMQTHYLKHQTASHHHISEQASEQVLRNLNTPLEQEKKPF